MKVQTEFPELVFGLVGPIGVDMDAVERKLHDALISVGYKTTTIRLTDLMRQVAVDGPEISDDGNQVEQYKSRISYANSVRERCDNDAALAGLAIADIKRKRSAGQNSGSSSAPEELTPPIERMAYILRQLKRSEEVELLRKVYGRKFIQISVHAAEDFRRTNLINLFSRGNSILSREECEVAADELIEIDMNERTDLHGQRIEEVFHLGDAFIDGRREDYIERSIRRFIEAFFGKNSISPTRDEYGAYIAASAALRSIDLSRQVGAAIFSSEGEIISLGCNEVPKYKGGTYWEDSEEKHRDFDDRTDSNRVEKNRIIFDFLKKLEAIGVLGEDSERIFEGEDFKLAVKSALISDITEFGRMTHAEMTALCDAARLGRATKDATIFVTTFPCHNCAKHIIASGISRVVFIEPYPKSKALSLHQDSIILDSREGERVCFTHFVGISPRRYRDIFEKKSRKQSDGKIIEWYWGVPSPMIEDKSSSYLYNEDSAVFSSLSLVAEEMNIIVY
ncbi:anti-phage dCTP deaminase [Stappia sp. 28M-7]|uniref:anti-phage dCTP deaminase n=1 Tax=Stappia sp. 28M-7 TaxID=2762596 RepID=UPI00163C0CB2|nr:anti-phage dCTP deaminase [Stappia sp. 28M-7]MBC2858937.1 deoxycytidylate deaminase [Stappia sp. 28M-7]